MTSKSLYSNYFRNTLKRKSWSTALSTLIFFLTLTLPALMIIGENAVKSTNEYENILNAENVCSRLSSLMNYKGISVKVGFVFLAIIAGITCFSYLHNKAKVDFYHSFPISRKQMFISNFVASIIPVLIGFFINFIVTNILIASFGYGDAILTVEIFKALAENILYFISIFSVISLCSILCGNTVITLILSCVALFGQSAIFLLLEALKGILYSTYFSEYPYVLNNVLRLSPITQMFNATIIGNTETRLSIFLAYIVVTAIIIGIALACFIKRKSEHSGIAIAFDKFKLPLKIYCCIIFALAFGILFREIVYQNIWIYFGIIFGILLAHALSEITFDFSFKSITKNWKTGVILSVICCAIVLGMNFDITKFDTRTLKPNQIKSFGMDFQDNYYGRENKSFENRSIDEPENVNTVAEIIKRAASFDRSSKVEQIYFSIVVKKKSFGTFKRSYSIEKSDENIDLINKIRYSEEYKRETNYIFSDKLKNSEKVIIKPSNSDLEQDYKFISGNKTEALLEVMREDYLNLTVEQGFNTIPVFIANFDVSKQEGYFISTFPIYKSYTNTLALLKEYGIEQKQLNVNDIEKITIYESQIERMKNRYSNKEQKSPYNYDNIKTFTDKANIEKLIKNAVPSFISRNMDKFTNDYNDYEILIYFKDNTEPQTFYTIDKDILDVVK